MMARRVVLDTWRYLGVAVANLAGTLNAGRVVTRGGIARFGALLQEAIQQEMLRGSLPTLALETRIEFVAMHADVLILGASALLLIHELGLSLTR
jgi:predicted NBD/HSP70 family sugar kinase